MLLPDSNITEAAVLRTPRSGSRNDRPVRTKEAFATDEQLDAKWDEFARIVDQLVQRIAKHDDLPI